MYVHIMAPHEASNVLTLKVTVRMITPLAVLTRE